MPTDEFDSKELITYWNQYLEQLNNQNQMPLYYSFKTVNPSFDENNNLVLEFNSGSIQAEFEAIKEPFMLALRTHLNNFKVDAVLKINSEKVENYTLTRKEQFMKLVEKNPALDTLRKRFDLDIENDR